MVGEFYVRTLLNVHSLLTNTNQTSKGETRFYVHIPLENKQMVDAHQLFLSGILHQGAKTESTNHTSSIHSVRWAQSALHLVRPEEKSCQCFRKLVFCGYNIYQQNTHDDNTTEQSEGAGDKYDNLNFTLWPGKYIDAFGRHMGEYYTCKPISSYFAEQPYHCEAYHKLRTHLLQNIEAQYSNLDQQVVQYRRGVLLRRKLVDESYRGDTREWTLVGLTQRTSRRTWLNLPNVTDACHATFLLGNSTNMQKVVCMEVNVESMSSPEEQFLVHHSLDALVGIHGAQLTQGIFLPSHKSILEILPWIPTYARGDWTQITGAPTPLGIIYHNTNLNHVGYSLDRSSVPLCEHTLNEEECFTNTTSNGVYGTTAFQFQWDNRNFVVEPDVILHFVTNFVLPMKNPYPCKKLLENQSDRFTLYNVWCQVDAENGAAANASELQLRHFYRPEVSDAMRRGVGKTHVATPQIQEQQTTQQLPVRCTPPLQSAEWNYYNALVNENHHLAERARQLTGGKHTTKEEVDRIPHRLIFTHKDNLFDCSNSASNSTPPDLFTLAENAKETVKAYSKVWPDLEYIFLTNKDCIKALNQTEPLLIPWMNNAKLEGKSAAFFYLFFANSILTNFHLSRGVQSRSVSCCISLPTRRLLL